MMMSIYERRTNGVPPGGDWYKEQNDVPLQLNSTNEGFPVGWDKLKAPAVVEQQAAAVAAATHRSIAAAKASEAARAAADADPTLADAAKEAEDALNAALLDLRRATKVQKAGGQKAYGIYESASEFYDCIMKLDVKVRLGALAPKGPRADAPGAPGTLRLRSDSGGQTMCRLLRR